MAFTAIQVTGATSDATSVAKAFASNVATGNLIVVEGFKFEASANDFVAANCTKSAGTATLSSFTLDKNISRDNGSGAKVITGIFSAAVTSGGSCTIQVAGGLAGAQINLGISEFHSDTATSFSVEGSNTGNGASGNGSTGNVTSAGAAVFVGGVSDFTSGATTHTEGAGYSIIYEEENGALHATGSTEYQIVASGTTDNADWTIGVNAGWAAALAVYKEVPTGTQNALAWITA